jgi:hypothetical protein
MRVSAARTLLGPPVMSGAQAQDDSDWNEDESGERSGREAQ